MGKRSINTTKSGKFMNPAEQARKEARKKELKKNKKQRQIVRAAVLKGKNPHHLIQDMEKIDRMEFDVNNPPQLNERVLRDKRKKLRETFAGVLKLYEKEDPEQYKHLRGLEVDYENKRTELMQYYESVKYAQQVQIEDIPMPSTQMPLTSTAPPPPAAPASTATSQIPLVRWPPGPPSNLIPHRVEQPPSSSPSAVSAPPSLISRCKAEDGHKGVATIEGKPQLKNLRAEITRFVPTSLRVKREDRGKKRDHKSSTGFVANELGQSMMKVAARHVPTKDDAYDQFMKEMEDLM